MDHVSELLDLDTFVAVKKAAPKVTGVSFGLAKEVVAALDKLAEIVNQNTDSDGLAYWIVPLKEIHQPFGEDVDLKKIGKACRELGLSMIRKSDGYYAAWSHSQLKILEEYFEPTK